MSEQPNSIKEQLLKLLKNTTYLVDTGYMTDVNSAKYTDAEYKFTTLIQSLPDKQIDVNAVCETLVLFILLKKPAKLSRNNTFNAVKQILTDARIK